MFFTYIGFDSVSTAAEEAKNPQRDLPIGIIGSLIVCTILYIGVSLVLLGMMKYTTFVSGEAADAPVAYALNHLGSSRFAGSVIVIGALMGMVSSLLVFQYGQARIWYAMSRDGLFPKIFSAVHPQFPDSVSLHLDRRFRGRAFPPGSLPSATPPIFPISERFSPLCWCRSA